MLKEGYKALVPPVKANFSLTNCSSICEMRDVVKALKHLAAKGVGPRAGDYHLSLLIRHNKLLTDLYHHYAKVDLSIINECMNYTALPTSKKWPFSKMSKHA